MAKSILGIDIGYDNMKLAVVSRGRVKKTVCLSMPKNLLREGHMVSVESMGELIRSTLRENGIRVRNAAIIMANETTFVKTVTMPRMSPDQLQYNLPFEFRDYITDEIRNYLFDYATLTEEVKEPKEAAEESEEPDTVELLAICAARSTMEELRSVARKAGLKLKIAAPALCSYINLIRRYENQHGSGVGEYCILDMGYEGIRMHMFKGQRHIVTRELEVGLSRLDEVLADAYSVDVHLAHTYLLTDYDGCQRNEVCRNVYGQIAVELMRALNFYHFSNPGSALADMWLCGGGAMIEPLCEAIFDTLDMTLHRAEELVPGGTEIENCNTFIQAVGIAMG